MTLLQQSGVVIRIKVEPEIICDCWLCLSMIGIHNVDDDYDADGSSGNTRFFKSLLS